MKRPLIGQFLNFRVLNVQGRPDASVEVVVEHPLMGHALSFIYDPIETPKETDGLWVGEVKYDYVYQAWTLDGIYQRCGHDEAMDCQCFGRLNAGLSRKEVEEALS